MNSFTGFIGTYRSEHARGIYRFSLNADTGAISCPELFLQAPDSKYLAMRKDGVLAAVLQREDGAGVTAINLRNAAHGCAAEALTEKSAGCYVDFDSDRIYSANFHEGTVSCYSLNGNSLNLIRVIDIAPEAGCHQVLTHQSTLLVPCMNLDEIRLFSAHDYAPCGAIRFPSGAGPRHAVFDRTHRRFFVAAQNDNALYSYSVQAGNAFSLIQRLPLLAPAAQTGNDEAAAIRLSADERFLYISVRGANKIAVLQLENGQAHLIQLVSCGGDHPRDIVLSPDGRYLLAANRYSNELVSFSLNASTGFIEKICGRAAVCQGVSIVFDVN